MGSLGKGLQAGGLSPSQRAPALVSTSSSQWQEGMSELHSLSTCELPICELSCGFGSECLPGQYVELAVLLCYLCMFLSLSVPEWLSSGV